MKIEKDEFCCFSTAELCEIGDDVDPMWGYSYETITQEDVSHLLHGGVIRFQIAGEYNCFLKFTDLFGLEMEDEMEMEDETDD